MNPASAYKRIPGRSRPNFGLLYLFELLFTFSLVALGERCRLFAGTDHLLVLRRRLFTETAHRFYYADIQAITVRRTSSASLASLLLLLLSATSLAFMLIAPRFAPFSDVGVYLLAGLSAGFVLGLALNILLGPTCITELYTAVHHERLECLSRWRTAQRALAQLQPRILAEQGPFDPSGLEPFAPEGPVLAANHAPSGGPQQAAAPGNSYTGGLHFALFLLFLGIVVSSLIDLLGDWTLKNAFDSIYYSVMLIVACVAVAKQRHSALPNDVRALTVFSLVASVVLFEGVQALVMSRSFIPMMNTSTPPDIFKMLDVAQPLRLTTIYINIVLFSITGLLGLVGLVRFRRTLAAVRRMTLDQEWDGNDPAH